MVLQSNSPESLQNIFFNVPQFATRIFRTFYTDTQTKSFVPSSPMYRGVNLCSELKNVDYFIDDKVKLKHNALKVL